MYFKTIHFKFAYDDILRIEYNSLVQAPVAEGWNFKRIITSPAPPGNLYRPLSTLSYRFNMLMAWNSPGSFHVLNIFLFFFCVFTVARLYEFFIGDKLISFIASLIFAVHPICIEAVANIVGRQEVLAAVFGLASITWLIQTYQRPKFFFFIGLIISVLLLFLAIHSKESAYTFAAIVPLSVFYIKHKFDSRFFWILASFIIVAIFCLIIRSMVLADQILITSDKNTIFFENPVFHLDFAQRIIPGLFLLSKYAQLIILPFKQAADYSIQANIFFDQIYSVLGILQIGILFILLSLIFRYRKQSWSLFGLWFFISFALTLNIITPIGTLMGERLAFFPAIGLIGFLIPLFFDVGKSLNLSRKHIAIAFCFLACVLALITSHRMLKWKDHASIYKATAIDAPQSPKAALNLGIHYMLREENFPAAKAELKRAIHLAPNYINAMQLLVRIAEIENNNQDSDYWKKEIGKIETRNKS